ncbi:MAG TPA: MarR family transcriptional regulator [Gemmatimonadales bacterium]|nr:MarR family transcriptional regulator [Gemmatimonadales bacterium]
MPSSPAAPDSDALKLWVVLSRAYQALLQHAKSDIGRSELTVAEFGALEALHHKGPLLLGDLQRKLLVSSGGVTWLVDRLAKQGLVVRRPSPDDRRASFVELTRKGERLIARLFPEHIDAMSRALAGLSPTEQAEAVRLLRKLGRAAAQASATAARTATADDADYD